MDAGCAECRKQGKEEEEEEEFNEEDDSYSALPPPPIPMPPADLNKLGGFEFFKKVLGSPKHILAPMVLRFDLFPAN